MMQVKEIIEHRLEELEHELEAHKEDDILSRQLIEADIEKVEHLLDYTAEPHARPLAKSGDSSK